MGQAERSYSCHCFIRCAVISRNDHGVDQVQFVFGQFGFAGLHRAAGDEYRGYIQAHGGVEHSRRDLVAIGNADHGVGAVRVDHVLHRVGNDVARGQAVEHAVVAHGDTVINRDGVELLGNAAGGLDLTRHQLAHVLQVHMAGYELGERIDHGDDGLLEIAVFHSGCAPQGAGTGHIAAEGRCFRAVVRHVI